MQLEESIPSQSLQGVESVQGIPSTITTADATEAALNQKSFFQAIDKFRMDPRSIGTASDKKKTEDAFDLRLRSTVQQMNRRFLAKGPTVVMEAAFFLLEQGLLNIPDIQRINVKQARALLWNAAWLQEHMNAIWNDNALNDHVFLITMLLVVCLLLLA